MADLIDLNFEPISSSISVNGFTFVCVYGFCDECAFVSILNWGVSTYLICKKDSFALDIHSILHALDRSYYSCLLPDNIIARIDIAFDLAKTILDRLLF